MRRDEIEQGPSISQHNKWSTNLVKRILAYLKTARTDRPCIITGRKQLKIYILLQQGDFFQEIYTVK